MTDAPTHVVPAAPIDDAVDEKAFARMVVLVIATVGATAIAFVFGQIWLLTIDIPMGGAYVAILSVVLLLLILPVLVLGCHPIRCSGLRRRAQRLSPV
jgi:membrane protein implicated in regulation of membrane protease activity